jgi:nucleoid DNA-binding protein
MKKESSQEFLDSWAKDNELSTSQVTKLYRSLVAIFRQLLLRRGALHLKGIGTFRVVHIGSRKSAHPITKEPIIVPSHKRVKYQRSAYLKKLVDEKNK